MSRLLVCKLALTGLVDLNIMLTHSVRSDQATDERIQQTIREEMQDATILCIARECCCKTLLT